jgi:hypothetical protein
MRHKVTSLDKVIVFNAPERASTSRVRVLKPHLELRNCGLVVGDMLPVGESPSRRVGEPSSPPDVLRAERLASDLLIHLAR